METAELALLTSITSLVVSLTTLVRDRYKLIVTYGTHITYPEGSGLKVVVANHGKRPVSIARVLIQTKDDAVYVFLFNGGNKQRIDLFEKQHTTIMHGDNGLTWTGHEQLAKYKIFVEDALGKKYLAKFDAYECL